MASTPPFLIKSNKALSVSNPIILILSFLPASRTAVAAPNPATPSAANTPLIFGFPCNSAARAVAAFV